MPQGKNDKCTRLFQNFEICLKITQPLMIENVKLIIITLSHPEPREVHKKT